MGHFTSGKYIKFGAISQAVSQPAIASLATTTAKRSTFGVKVQGSVIKCQGYDSELKAPCAALTCEEKLVESSAPETTAMEIDTDTTSGNEVVRTSEDFIDALAVVLARWVQQAAAMPQKPKPGRFHSARAPPISIIEYLKRIRTYFVCSDECFVIALVYIDRISKVNPSMAVCNLTVHRLLVVSVMLAAKFHDDLYYSNSHYGKVGGVNLKELNLLEATMLKVLDWHMSVSTEEYQLYHSLVYDSVYQPVERTL